MKATIGTLTLLAAIFILPSCRDREAEQREKELKAAEAFDKQHKKSMEESSQGKFPEPKPAGPIR